MTDESPIIFVVAYYDLRDDAQSDLAAVKRFIVEKSIAFYDGALITTDAWDQAEIHEWQTPLLSGPAGFVRWTLAAAAAGRSAGSQPRLTGLPGTTEGLARGDLERVGNTLRQDATALVVAVQTGYEADFRACFSRASRIESKEVAVDANGTYPPLSAALNELMAPSR
jgi:hypothetical protein